MLTNLDARDFHATAPSELHARPRRRASQLRPLLLPVPAPSRVQKLYLQLRRGTEIAATLLIGAVALPLVALAALVVKLTSRGPAFYTQTRIGRHGRTFTILKLRTMVDNCESLTGPRWTMPGDPRVTAVGWLLRRSHLDELPQLWNVLKGDMSLIGPRPERPEFVQELDKHIPGYQRRHAVLPGITGLAQVQLPPDTDMDSVRRKLLYDLYFVRHNNPWLDAQICLATVLHMLGMPCSLVQKLRLVPGPERVEPETMPAILPLPAAPRLQRRAA